MPGQLGGLVVSLGLDAAEFITGMTKAEREAAQFAAKIERGMAAAANAAAVGLAALAAAGTAAFVAIDKFAKEAAQFQDLSEKTGASASSLASFAVAANVAGTSMESVAAASIKLTKNLSGVDDESKAAGAALTALGIPIKEFKSLSPDKQIETIAKALAQFEDSAGKTAVAVALFGKAGADALPFLKELGEGVGRVNILTDEQIKRADAYSDAQARTMATLQAYAQAVATEALPAITALTGAATDLIKQMLGINSAGQQFPGDEIREFAEKGAVLLAQLVDAAQNVTRAFLAISIGVAAGVAQAAAILSGNVEEAARIGRKAVAEIKAQFAQPLFSTLVEERIKLQRALEIGPPAPAKKPLDFSGAQKATGGGADRVSEAERFLESLKRQLETTQQLTAEEKALEAIQSGRLKGLTPAIQDQILATAREIDQIKALEAARKAAEKALEEDIRAQAALQREREHAARAAETSATRAEEINEALRDEIAIMLGGEDARKAIERDHALIAISKKKDFLATRELAGANVEEVAAIKQEIVALEERAQLLTGRNIAEQLRKDAEQLQQFKNIFADTFADEFSQFIDGSKSAADAFKSFVKTVEQQITRLAAQNIANALFGGNTGGGFDLSKILGALLGGASGGGAGWTSGFDLGGLAGGTSFWRGGPTVVGESGPEVVNLPRGTSVVPNEESQKLFGPKMNFVINVLPGASAKTAQQAAAATGIAVQRALVRNT